ncbi:hypothetical protein ACHAW5_003400 [Stephanodiscus triporus]|uniref:Uncharacterized protein n=1 Tax=Stephanodiscus triporus TaxID=2934178 RepID=A0ABD3NTE7_9STRA
MSHCGRGVAAAMLLSPAARRLGEPRTLTRMDAAVGADTRFAVLTGRVLTPGSSGDGWWDGRCAASPVILPPLPPSRPKWQCFYYGRPSDRWNADLPAFLPTGVSGLAESDDGLNWSRVRGPLEGGAVLRPSNEAEAFDHVHVGITDVIPQPDGSYAALYLGGSAEEVSLGMGPGPIRGFRMRPGAATSRDGRGLVWERVATANPLLDVGAVGAWDANFCSWPRALPLDAARPDGEWIMTYHALAPPGADGASAPRWAVGAAVGESGHALGPYTKLDDPVLCGGAGGTFDEAGIGTRHVVHRPDGPGLVMVYEGVGADGRHRLGLATSADGRDWAKVEGLGPDPGGPIFEGAPAEEDAWDNGNVGTPWVMPLADGRWRLYYVGTSSKGRTVAIGAAEANDLFSCWERVAVSGSGLCIDERDVAGETSLILAAERGDSANVRILLDAGADPCAVSESGWTALHGAAECNCVPAIEMLVEAGADVSASARSGKTPLDIALQYARPEAAEQLIALGASGSAGSMV